MLKAIIDLGTNTFNLIIAEIDDDRFQLIYSEKEGVALGMGGIHKNIIAEDALKRAKSTLLRFRKIIDDHKVERIKAFGTSAIRDAINADELVSFTQKNLRIPVDVIDGNREADLIFSGVSKTHDLAAPGIVMDIGGGSTEFIAYDNRIITEKTSLNIGVSRIFQKFNLSDPLQPDEVMLIESFLEQASNGFFVNRKESVLIGASGSFETFYEFIEKKAFPEGSHCSSLNIPKFQSVLNEIIFSSQEERERNPWIIPIRKKMAPIAAVKTNWVLSKLPLKEIFVSPFSLKEGALFEL